MIQNRIVSANYALHLKEIRFNTNWQSKNDPRREGGWGPGKRWWRRGRRDEGDEEVGAREKSDAVKHSAGRVIRLRKSAGSTLLHYRVTILPTPGYIFIRDVARAWPKTLNACFVLRLAPKTREFSR